MSSAALLVALLSLLPQSARVRCVRDRASHIAAQADEAARVTGVPAATLLVVGYLESALGCDPRSGGCWGAPISPARRLTAGTSMHAARALAWGFRRCETTEGAIAHFRYGRCTTPRRHGAGYTPAQAIDLIVRVVARAAGGAR